MNEVEQPLDYVSLEPQKRPLVTRYERVARIGKEIAAGLICIALAVAVGYAFGASI